MIVEYRGKSEQVNISMKVDIRASLSKRNREETIPLLNQSNESQERQEPITVGRTSELQQKGATVVKKPLCRAIIPLSAKKQSASNGNERKSGTETNSTLDTVNQRSNRQRILGRARKALETRKRPPTSEELTAWNRWKYRRILLTKAKVIL